MKKVIWQSFKFVLLYSLFYTLSLQYKKLNQGHDISWYSLNLPLAETQKPIRNNLWDIYFQQIEDLQMF